ncbi:MAG TPA: choice-of-anchor Q domain-containing protein [Verrucomicrobiae bacterium]|nr:choice-of-anchor Q domain-containing protein [Verrucomicrobiae bacterium]
MKHQISILTAGLALAFLACTSRGAATLTISDGVNPAITIVDNGPGDGSPSTGVISATTNVGSWTISVNNAATKPAFGSAALPAMSLAVHATSTASGTIRLTYSDNSFGPAIGPINAYVAGDTPLGSGAAAAVTVYVDSENVVGSTSMLTAETGAVALPTSTTGSGSLNLFEPFSMTAVLALYASGPTTINITGAGTGLNQVTVNADAGTGSLRNVIANAPSSSDVTFVPALSGSTIVLTNGQIIVSNSVTIDASALPNGIQISGNHASRIFTVNTNVGLALSDLTLRDANGSGSDGGALLNFGTAILNGCTLTGNSAGSGGAIKNALGTLILYQSTLCSNSTGGGGGGGIVNYASLTLDGCTLTGNSAGAFGGAIYSETGAQAILDNTIAAGNSAVDIYNNGTLTFVGSNIVQSVSVNPGTGTNPIIANPQLAPLGSYGGPTQTMPPLHGSPAIDAGSDPANFFATDQRGYPRPSGAHVDIGAVEAQIAPAPFRISEFVPKGNGSVSLGFSNIPGGSFTVFAGTNAGAPRSTWLNLGPAVENLVGSGNFQFIDSQSTSYRQRFYYVSSP